jgi:hypothetical protein
MSAGANQQVGSIRSFPQDVLLNRSTIPVEPLASIESNTTAAIEAQPKDEARLRAGAPAFAASPPASAAINLPSFTDPLQQYSPAFTRQQIQSQYAAVTTATSSPSPNMTYAQQQHLNQPFPNSHYGPSPVQQPQQQPYSTFSSPQPQQHGFSNYPAGGFSSAPNNLSNNTFSPYRPSPQSLMSSQASNPGNMYMNGTAAQHGTIGGGSFGAVGGTRGGLSVAPMNQFNRMNSSSTINGSSSNYASTNLNAFGGNSVMNSNYGIPVGYRVNSEGGYDSPERRGILPSSNYITSGTSPAMLPRLQNQLNYQQQQQQQLLLQQQQHHIMNQSSPALLNNPSAMSPQQYAFINGPMRANANNAARNGAINGNPASNQQLPLGYNTRTWS